MPEQTPKARNSKPASRGRSNPSWLGLNQHYKQTNLKLELQLDSLDQDRLVCPFNDTVYLSNDIIYPADIALVILSINLSKLKLELEIINSIRA